MLARLDGLDRLANVHLGHLQLLKTMHEVGIKWVEKFLEDDDSLIFRLGFHSVCHSALYYHLPVAIGHAMLDNNPLHE